MIDIIMRILYAILEFFINIFPTYTGDLPNWESFGILKGYVFMFDSFLPITLLFSFLTIILSIELIYFIYRFAMRIYSIVRKS
jgi:hypothetical protein